MKAALIAINWFFEDPTGVATNFSTSQETLRKLDGTWEDVATRSSYIEPRPNIGQLERSVCRQSIYNAGYTIVTLEIRFIWPTQLTQDNAGQLFRKRIEVEVVAKGDRIQEDHSLRKNVSYKLILW